MAQENEMQEFTRSFFRGRPDLSTLTHSIVRRKFLAQVGRNHLKPEEKQVLKRLVEEELLKMQVDEAGSREEKLNLNKKVKRPPTPCSDPDSKRFRFNSESESSSAASSPDSFGSPSKNGTAAAEVSPAKEEKGPSRALKKVVESSDEEQQEDLTANMRIENSEEEEGSVRTSKVWKEGSSEEDEKKEYKGRTRKKPGIKNKQTSGKASARKKQAREEREDSEEEPVQRISKKAGGNRGAPSHQENEKESEEKEIVAKKKESREEKEVEEEEWKPRARGNGGERSAWEGRSCKQKSRAGRQTRDWEDSGDEKEAVDSEDEKEAVDSREDSGEDEEPLVHWKSKDRTQCKGGQSQSRSNEDGEDKGKVQSPAQLGSVNGEESDLEREMSDSEAGESPKGERKNRSSKKSSKKGRTRSSSSSSDGSPEPKGRKAASGRRGEDHPAVMRLKRYIRACGAHRNYKKLLGSCHSHKERLSVLRAELEALGMKGNPSLEKCRALKEQREEAAEVASLDVSNIISSSGRPRRRTAWNPSGEAVPPGKLYRRTLDSEEERPRQAPPDWSHMRGIISSDAESN
ncbi:HIRA interacting protein 3 [Ictidomys tridecemlineatus]|uniref:HIRA interacting protein 3 n=1 Tax=Ictidomys tridecemlineatus TaxID=43179 RepID=I3MW54_ICTTR|nr:HIRA-interacting protein 3 [Ictidomys tridecemlineatus]KAG3259603.1 HIRA interacting protein 3 [Ictidomys tridecemlineatus]